MQVEAGNTLNELGWWSSWARRIRVDDTCEVLASKEFDEPLFNRVLFLRPPSDPASTVSASISQLEAAGAVPSLFVEEDERFRKTREEIVARGLRTAGRFIVMRHDGATVPKEGGAMVKGVSGSDLDAWARVYLRAFYGDENLLGAVRDCVRKAHEDKRNVLLLAELESEPVGALAMRVDGGLAGVYCVGTDPAHRRSGVAGSMLAKCMGIAAQSKSAMLLQVFESDGFEPFYSKRGFSRVLTQEIMTEP